MKSSVQHREITHVELPQPAQSRVNNAAILEWLCGRKQPTHGTVTNRPCSTVTEKRCMKVAFNESPLASATMRTRCQAPKALSAGELGGARCPFPTALTDRLRKLKEIRNAVLAQLVFPNKRGNPNNRTDMIVKRVAFRSESELRPVPVSLKQVGWKQTVSNSVVES
jgi:hypothetical protein